MNYRLARVVGLKQPTDGYTKEEQVLEVLIAKETIRTLYAKLPTARQKAIVALHFELGYPQEVVADIFGMTQPSIKDEIELVKQILLGKKHTPRKRRDQYTEDELLKIAQLFLLD